MKVPAIVVNAKTYETATGDKVLELAKIMAELAKKYDASLALAAQASDIRLVANTGVPILAQHIDSIVYGNNTGYILPEAVEDAGATGTLINHAEHKLTLAQIEACVAKCKELGFTSIVCTNNVATS
ncbi:MAG: triose-phosphate isomerase, partial [Candidatus Thermoplasmatota archaeon]|nr:triose-phosphate isomerase [Candidatus Thermoplasmatota archaeon]